MSKRDQKPQKKVEEEKEFEEEVEFDEAIFSEVDPNTLNLNDRVLSALTGKMKVKRLTKVQAGSFQPIIDGKDVLMRADTGSGKTLSYLLPIMQRLTTDFDKITRDLGPICIIVSPTRELCLQISTILNHFKSQMPFITPGTLLGGEKPQSEKKRIRKGINVLIATPGRLLYHLQNTQNLTTYNLKFLVLDEADRLLDMGFLNKVTEIISCLPPRQTILVSATLHNQLQELQDLSLTDPVTVGELKDEEFSVPATLVQRYVFVEPKWRLPALAALLSRCVTDIPNMKCIVFINCCLAVDFYYTFFSYFKYMTPAERRSRPRPPRQPRDQNQENEQNQGNSGSGTGTTIQDIHASTDNDEVGATSPYLKCEIFRIHGNVEQIDRAKSIARFTAAESAVLFCTDVAARGLDIPDVTTIIQFDPPIDTEDYVHRVGRTARIGKDGIAYLFLQGFEEKFVDLLTKMNIEIKEYSYKRLVKRAVQAMGGDDDDLCMAAMRKETFSTVIDNELENLATRAWASAIKAYTSHRKETRKIFDKRYLHLGHMAASFGLEKTPAELSATLAEEREILKKSKRPDEEDAKDKKYLPAFEDRTSEFL
ncbi:DEAD/DEAH box helicase family protein [Tritrichomonas foetus]|uniref:ATP-dependent RNA helicase n=1 Tax=Tritrichomonas foetus TaxID=1144522 RepID=A0A1J4KK13_9EUKA|nr:DEAD/DEAH box helicase family protein [Tritrichomonas foetus]|eukprot:OHT11639.1 DEAD/DEAH box helicase family protein [Tritrichomonas foetus]